MSLGPRIYLTGRVTVEQHGAIVLDEPALPGRHGRLTFAFLASRRRQPTPRADLAEALWGHEPPRELDTTLNAILSRLRSVVRRTQLDAGIVVNHGLVELQLPAATWIDLVAGGNAIDEAEGAWRRGDLALGWSAANVAVAIARRSFLPGEEAPWIESWRRRLGGVLVRGLECLSAISAANGEPAVALQHAEEVVELEPFRETAYQHLMRLHARMGNAAEAIRVFGRCREHLREELGASPSAETERLYLTLLRGG